MKHLTLILLFFVLDNGLSGHLKSTIRNTNVMYDNQQKQTLVLKEEINLKKVVEISNNWKMINKITVIGNLCFVATQGTGIRVLNIEYITNPQEIGVIDISVKDFSVQNEHIFIINSSGLKIINIKDINNPFEEASINTVAKKWRIGKKEFKKIEKADFNCIHVNDDYLYLGDKTGYIYIYNISDPIQPIELSTFRTEGGKINAISVFDNYASILCSAAPWASDIIVGQGVHIYDLLNIAEPSPVAFHKTADIPMHICSDSIYVYIVGCSRPRKQAQMHIFFKDDLTSSFHPFSTIEEKFTSDAELLGDYLYLAASDGIYIYNRIADKVGYLQTKDEVRSLAKSGDFLLTAVNNKLVIYRYIQNEKSQK